MSDLSRQTLEAAELAGQRFYLNVSSRFSGLQGGTRFGRNTGNSLEFLDHREYQPGDDIRHIDWNALARSDRLTVKLFREEVAPHLDLLIDASASMALENSRKSEGLFALAALLRVAALNAGYTTTSWIVKDRCQRVEPDNLPVRDWRGAECDFSGNVGQTFAQFLPALRPSGVRILLSDLFWNEEPLAVLRQLSGNAALLVVVQLLAGKDISPDLSGNIRLVDSETGELIELVADESLLRDYQSNFARHQENWKRDCSRSGSVFCQCVAESFLQDFVAEDLVKSEILMSRSR
ncbi:MAG: DUF58 domain-containing protein [Candidatus Riflebacteria bacterium]|nr:DUF58 domain-containing protein [Candidatus Riflebacteria bacterium]